MTLILIVFLRSNRWIPRRETDKVVSLENKVSSVSLNEQPASPKPAEAWTTVGSNAVKSKSSANLSSMGSALKDYASSAANKSKFGPAAGDKSGPGNATPKGGAGGIPRSTSSGAVNSGKPQQQQPSPRGGGEKKGFGADKKTGGKPLPSESTITVKPGSTPATAASSSASEPSAAAPTVDESAPFDKESSTWKRIKATGKGIKRYHC